MRLEMKYRDVKDKVDEKEKDSTNSDIQVKGIIYHILFVLYL